MDSPRRAQAPPVQRVPSSLDPSPWKVSFTEPVLKTVFETVFTLMNNPYWWKVKFLHISDILFSYKQMVFPEIKALFRCILMHIFAILPGFFNSAVKKHRIFVFWRSNFCIFWIFYFLTSRWFSQNLMLTQLTIVIYRETTDRALWVKCPLCRRDECLLVIKKQRAKVN